MATAICCQKEYWQLLDCKVDGQVTIFFNLDKIYLLLIPVTAVYSGARKTNKSLLDDSDSF